MAREQVVGSGGCNGGGSGNGRGRGEDVVTRAVMVCAQVSRKW